MGRGSGSTASAGIDVVGMLRQRRDPVEKVRRQTLRDLRDRGRDAQGALVPLGVDPNERELQRREVHRWCYADRHAWQAGEHTDRVSQPAIVRYAVELYKAGYDIGEVAVLVSRNPETVRNWLRRAGAVGGYGDDKPLVRRKELTEDEHARIAELRAASR